MEPLPAVRRPPFRRRLRAGLVVAALPVAFAALLATSWTRARLLVPGGDEPHYLVMAESLIQDGDLDLKNNYERAPEAYGPIKPHAIQSASGWYPFHAPGLSFLVALPHQVGGVLGARVGLALLAGLLPLALYVWASTRMPRGSAAWLVLGATVSLPFCFGAVVIYPDLPAGVVAVATALWLLTRREASGSAAPRLWRVCTWSTFWLAAGLLVWSNVKFVATTAVLALAGLMYARLERGASRRAALLTSPLLLVGPLLLAAFHEAAFGSPFGPRGMAEITTSPARALMIFLGLHLDQAQGLFLQQPMFLAGVPALAFVAVRDRRTALFLAALYASLIVPNSFQMARFGGGGPAGRFGWSAAWLWMIPIGLAVAASPEKLARFVRPAALLSVAVQATLALRWIPDPSVLFPTLDERIWARNSLVAPSLRYALPSYYFWDFWSYLFYVPNVVAIAGVILLAVTGARAAMPLAWRWLRPAWVAYAVVAGLLLPVVPAGGTAEQNARERAVVRTSASQIVRRFEAERMSPGALAPNAREDPSASDGRARATRPGRPDRFMMYGPWIDLSAGRYRAVLAVRLIGAIADSVGVFEVTADNGRRVVAREAIAVSSLATTAYRRIWLAFETDVPLTAVEFRFIAEPGADVLLDYVELTPILPHPPEPD